MSTPALNFETDKDGYLLHFADWTIDIAALVAQREGIALTPAHWDVIYALRTFYTQYEQSPAMRPLVKFIAQTLGADKGNSIYLLKLFPGSPAKIASKIAGLPRPEHCL